MSSEPPAEPLELYNLLAGFVFHHKAVLVDRDGSVFSFPLYAAPAESPAAEGHVAAWAPADVFMPELGTATHQGEGAIRLATSSGPDIILTTGVVRAILTELCDKSAGLVGEIYRARTGVPPE